MNNVRTVFLFFGYNIILIQDLLRQLCIALVDNKQYPFTRRIASRIHGNARLTVTL